MQGWVDLVEQRTTATETCGVRWCVDRRCGERSGQASAAARCRPRGQAEGPARGPSVSPSLFPMSDVKREQTFRTEIKTETEPLRPRSRTRPIFRPCRSKSRTKFWRSDQAETFGCKTETETETRPDVQAGLVSRLEYLRFASMRRASRRPGAWTGCLDASFRPRSRSSTSSTGSSTPCRSRDDSDDVADPPALRRVADRIYVLFSRTAEKTADKYNSEAPSIAKLVAETICSSKRYTNNVLLGRITHKH